MFLLGEFDNNVGGACTCVINGCVGPDTGDVLLAGDDESAWDCCCSTLVALALGAADEDPLLLP